MADAIHFGLHTNSPTGAAQAKLQNEAIVTRLAPLGIICEGWDLADGDVYRHWFYCSPATFANNIDVIRACNVLDASPIYIY